MNFWHLNTFVLPPVSKCLIPSAHWVRFAIHVLMWSHCPTSSQHRWKNFADSNSLLWQYGRWSTKWRFLLRGSSTRTKNEPKRWRENCRWATGQCAPWLKMIWTQQQLQLGWWKSWTKLDQWWRKRHFANSWQCWCKGLWGWAWNPTYAQKLWSLQKWVGSIQLDTQCLEKFVTVIFRNRFLA